MGAGAGSRGTEPWRHPTVHEFILSVVEGPEGRARDTSGPPGPTGFDRLTLAQEYYYCIFAKVQTLVSS